MNVNWRVGVGMRTAGGGVTKMWGFGGVGVEVLGGRGGVGKVCCHICPVVGMEESI